MPNPQSLDELIALKAVEFADQLRKAAALADKEEEIRIEVETFGGDEFHDRAVAAA